MYSPGDQLGSYSIGRRLGNGAFGTVWLAERRTSITTTQVAIKISTDDDLNFDAARHEAGVWVAASGHPNVLPIIEADIIDDQLIIVSEYAKDGTLDDWLAKFESERPPLHAVQQVILGLVGGLEHLHNRGIIHRDIKPANILFQGDVPRLADFGISRVVGRTAQSRTSAGTPAFMAPEAFDGVRNVQTDLWALGVLMYKLFTGRLPFPNDDFGSMVKAIFFEECLSHEGRIPIGFQTIVSRLLKKEPSQRFSSAEEVKNELQSSLVAWHLLVEPKPSAAITKDPYDLSDEELEHVTDGPRPHHYSFAHVFLRDRALQLPIALLHHLPKAVRSGAKGALGSYWLSAHPPGTPFVPPDGLSCLHVDISEKYHSYVVVMPRAVRMAEAIYVAVLLPIELEPSVALEDLPRPPRYFTLELSYDTDEASLCTYFCEWSDGGHKMLIPSGGTTTTTFVEAIKSTIV